MYITQENKKTIAAALKVALKDYPTVKCSLSIQHHTSITCTISQGPKCLDTEGQGHVQVNHYYIDQNYGKDAAKILNLINDCLHIGHYDNSDVQTDYFDCAWYVGITIGKWNKPFVAV